MRDTDLETSVTSATIEIGLTQLDLTRSAEVFARMPGAEVHLLWKTQDAVSSDRGLVSFPPQPFRTAHCLTSFVSLVDRAKYLS